MRSSTVVIQLFGALLLLASASDRAFAAAGGLDPSFGVNGKVRIGFGGGSDRANAIIQQSVSGGLIVAGSVEDGGETRFLLARYLTNGTPDLTFGDRGVVRWGDEYNALAWAVTIQLDGRIVVAGFSASRPAVARFLVNGAPDPTFGVGGTVTLSSIPYGDLKGVVIQGGKILLAGELSSGATRHFGLVRLEANGTLDATFAGGGFVITPILNSSEAETLTLQPDGKILLIGTATDNTSRKAVAIARYDANGFLDTSFDGDGFLTRYVGSGSSFGHAATLQIIGTSTKLIVAGETDNGAGARNSLLIRFNPDGSIDTTFGSSGVVVQAVGLGDDAFFSVRIVVGTTHENPTHIYAAGRSRVNNTGAFYDVAVCDYLVSGAPSTGFDGDGTKLTSVGSGDDVAYDLIVAGSRITLAGTSRNGTLASDLLLLRYTTSGALDAALDGDGIRTDDVGHTYSGALSMAVQPDGRIVLAGFTNQAQDFALARLHADGSPDSSFSGDGRATLDLGDGSIQVFYDVTLQPDSKILAVGAFESGSLNELVLARFLPDGSIDPTFGTGGIVRSRLGGFDEGTCVALQPDGRIVAAGDFLSGGKTLIRVSRFLQDGTIDNSFGTNGHVKTAAGGTEAAAFDMALQPDGGIVLTGEQFAASGADQIVTLRLTPAGAFDPTFGSGGIVTADLGPGKDTGQGVALQSDGRILVTGYREISAADRNPCVLRYSSSGQLDPTLDGDGIVIAPTGSADETGRAIGIQADGRILMAGVTGSSYFTDQLVARFEATGAPDLSFGAGGFSSVDYGSNDGDEADAITRTATGQILVAGIGDFLMTVTRLDPGAPVTGVPERTGPAASGLFAGRPWPNPTRGAASIELQLTGPSRLAIDLFDVSGRLVRRLAAPSIRPAGASHIEWDGLDAAGSRVTAGIYFVRFTGSDQAVTRRIVVIP